MDRSVTFWHKVLGDQSVTFRHVVLGDRSVTFRHVLGDRSVTFRHGIWDRSVTFRHDNNKEKESWIMLIYSNSKNLFPKWVWCVLIGVLSVVANGSGTCWLSPIKYCGWFYIIIYIYCFLFWVGQWYLLSTCSLYWPLLVFFFLLFVECSKRANNFD